MKAKKVVLYSVIFEVKYAQGYVYLDRCGQTINDIQNDLKGWTVVASPSPDTATLSRVSKDFIVSFNSDRFNFTANYASETHPDQTCQDAAALWKIIKGNLGLTSFYRMGCRLNYNIPFLSWDEAKAFTATAMLSAPIFHPLIDNSFELLHSSDSSCFAKDGIEYRLEVSPIQRAEGVDPNRLVIAEGRSLPKGQRQARLDYQKRIAKYSRDPMFVVQLDVDCVWYDPEEVDVVKYMKDCTAFVEENFLPLLEQTWSK
jgi:hypothetical protein